MSSDAIIFLDQIDSALAGVAPKLTERERHLAVAVYQQLAKGEPVSAAQVAVAAGLPYDESERALHSWPAVFRDSEDRIVGFWGLTIQPMSHRVRISGRDLYAWCAWDPFLLAPIISNMNVTTRDPIGGDTISYNVGPDGTVTDLSHPSSVLSFLRPDQPWDDNVMETFCHYILHFTGSDTARQWTGDHPGTFVINLADAAELGRRHAQRTLAPAVDVADRPQDHQR